MENKNKKLNVMQRTVELIDVKTDDVIDYKNTALLLVFPKCNKSCPGCQNEHLRGAETKIYVINDIINLYNRLSEHKAIVCAGLDPLDSMEDIENLLEAFNASADMCKPVDFVIYTGYTIEEMEETVQDYLFQGWVKSKNMRLIVKYGRYDKNNNHKYVSKTLGIELAGNNQKARIYSRG